MCRQRYRPFLAPWPQHSRIVSSAYCFQYFDASILSPLTNLSRGRRSDWRLPRYNFTAAAHCSSFDHLLFFCSFTHHIARHTRRSTAARPARVPLLVQVAVVQRTDTDTVSTTSHEIHPLGSSSSSTRQQHPCNIGRLVNQRQNFHASNISSRPSSPPSHLQVRSSKHKPLSIEGTRSHGQKHLSLRTLQSPCSRGGETLLKAK